MLRIIRQRTGFLGFSRYLSTTPILQNSICKEGEPLNLKVKKGPKEPVALADSEYPEWLWKLLDTEYQKEQLDSDPIRKAKRELRKANIAKIKANNFTAKLNG